MVFFPRSIKKFEKNHGGRPKIFLPQITLTLPYYLYWSQNIKELWKARGTLAHIKYWSTLKNLTLTFVPIFFPDIYIYIHIYRKSRISEWYKNTNEKVGTKFFSEKKHVIWNLWHLFVWVANLEFHSNLVQTGAIWTSASGKLNWSLMRAVQSCPGNGRFLAILFSNNHYKLHNQLKIEFRICSQAVKYEMNIE